MVGKLLFIFLGTAISTSFGLSDYNPEPLEELTQDLIIELKDKYGEEEDERAQVQKEFYRLLGSNTGYNYHKNGGITGVSNMVFVEVGESALDYILSCPLVDNVYYNYLNETAELTEEDVEEEGTSTISTFNPNQESTAPDKNYSREEMNAPGVEATDTDYSAYNQGDGTVIAVLDNSFTLDHPAFQELSSSIDVRYSKDDVETLIRQNSLSGKYYNNKIIYYYDYADGNDDVLNASENHGQHVAGIATANNTSAMTNSTDSSSGLIGIAPNAQLAFMKVFGDNSSGAYDTDILKAINDAWKLDVDVINMSLGSPLYESTSYRSQEIDSNGSGAFAVIRQMVEEGITFSISAGNEGRANMMYDSTYQTNDFGAYGSGFSLDNVDGGIIGSYADSAYATIVASGRLSADTTSSNATAYTQHVSDFSSDGPTYDMHISPDVITPGENIWSADNGQNGNYYVYMDGTSMAAPNYAGAVANVLSNLDWADMSEGDAKETAREAARKELKARIQSTAEPYVQDGTSVATSKDAYYSVRKQGAGLVNIQNAFNTDVYFYGVNNIDGDVDYEINTTSAEIELGNTDIADGKFDFDIAYVNESGSSKSYTATLYVETSDIYNEDGNFASLFDTVIDTYSWNVTLESGSVSSDKENLKTISVNYQLDDDALTYLDTYFPNGTYIEGYIVFEPTDTTDEITLSVPFLGFYGDYATADPVEEFDFVREDDTMLYGSDLLNDAYHNTGTANANFVSTIVTSDSSFTSANISSIASGSVDPQATYNEVILNDDGDIVVGVDQVSNSILIQQVVYRTIASNKVEVVDSNGNTVLSTTLQGVDDGGTYSTTGGMIYKSMLIYGGTTSVTGVKAYATLDFKDSSGNLLIDEGEYTLRFTYTTLYASGTSEKTSVVKEYGLEVRDEAATRPSYQGNSLTTTTSTDGTVTPETYRLKLEDNVTDVRVSNGWSTTTLDVLEDDAGTYVELDVADYESRDKMLFTITNEYNLVDYHLVSYANLTNGYFLDGTGNIFSSTNTFTFTTTDTELGDSGTITRDLQVRVANGYGNNVSLESTVSIGMGFPDWALKPTSADDLLEYVNITAYDAFGDEMSSVSYEYVDGSIVFSGVTSGHVEVTFNYDPDYGTTVNDGGDTTSNTGLIIGVSVGAGVVVLAGAGVGLFFLFRKKRLDKTTEDETKTSEE